MIDPGHMAQTDVPSHCWFEILHLGATALPRYFALKSLVNDVTLP